MNTAQPTRGELVEIVRKAVSEGYLQGFLASGEGWNGEFPSWEDRALLEMDETFSAGQRAACDAIIPNDDLLTFTTHASSFLAGAGAMRETASAAVDAARPRLTNDPTEVLTDAERRLDRALDVATSAIRNCPIPTSPTTESEADHVE